MPYRIALFALCLVFFPGEAANAQRSQQLLTKEDCVQLEEASYDKPGNFESGGFYNSKEYRQCSDAAFSMEPNAGLEILNAFQPEGSCNDLFSDIQRLEKRLFYATVNNIKSMPQYMQCCYEIKDVRRCEGIFADDSEHFDALMFEPLHIRVDTAERVVLHSDKPNYVLQSLFFNGQAVPFTQTDTAAWEAILPVAKKTTPTGPFDFNVLNAIFAWNGKDSEHSLMGKFRKAVWYYKTK